MFNACLFVTESGANGSSKEVQKLKKRNLQLEEENNLLKLKIELLLDMVSRLQLTCTDNEREALLD